MWILMYLPDMQIDVTAFILLPSTKFSIRGLPRQVFKLLTSIHAFQACIHAIHNRFTAMFVGTVSIRFGVIVKF